MPSTHNRIYYGDILYYITLFFIMQEVHIEKILSKKGNGGLDRGLNLPLNRAMRQQFTRRLHKKSHVVIRSESKCYLPICVKDSRLILLTIC